MYKALILLLVALVAVQADNTTVTPTVAPTPAPGTQLVNVQFDVLSGGFLAKVKLQAGIAYTLVTPIGFQAIVKVKANCSVGLGASLKFTGLPSLFQKAGDINIGINAAFGVYVDVQGALEQVTLQSPPLPLFGQEITNGFNAAVLALDDVTNPNTRVFSVLQATYDAETKRITVSLPPNLPVIMFGKVQSHASVKLGSSYSCIGGANQTISWDGAADVTFRSNIANVITVAKTNVATKGQINALAKAGTALGVFLNISIQTQASHDSTIRITYNQTDLINAGIKNEANLKLAFFNEVTGLWDFGSWITIVNTTAHYVEARVPHFSTWAPIEQGNPQNSASQASMSIVIMAVCALLALFQ